MSRRDDSWVWLLLLASGQLGGRGSSVPGFEKSRKLALKRFPVPGVTSYADTFGHPWGPGRTHQGVDIFAPEGTPVVAVADGIARTKEGPLGGKMVTLELPDRTWFLYSHLQRFAAGLANGQKVKAGQLLGHVGDTGNALKKGSHVHFEVHPLGGPAVDPYPALKAVSVDGPAEPGTMPNS